MASCLPPSARCQRSARTTPVRAAPRRAARNAGLASGRGGIIFTHQKFALLDGKRDRRCLADPISWSCRTRRTAASTAPRAGLDEKDRQRYVFGYAKHLRDAEKRHLHRLHRYAGDCAGDKDTRAVFGDRQHLTSGMRWTMAPRCQSMRAAGQAGCRNGRRSTPRSTWWTMVLEDRTWLFAENQSEWAAL